MTLMIRFFLLLSLVLFMSGCGLSRPSFIANRDTDYLRAKSIPPLRIPPGVSSNAFESYYPVSTREYPESAKNVSIVPPGLNN
jgi:uncharacterized lipoprotein